MLVGQMADSKVVRMAEMTVEQSVVHLVDSMADPSDKQTVGRWAG